MVRWLSLPLAVAAVASSANALAVSSHEESQDQASLRGGKIWPFSSASSWPFQQAKAAATPASLASSEHTTTIQDIKDEVMLSATFGKKTQALCQTALDSERTKCRQLAGQRLFCALLQRHEQKYANVPGVADEKERCKEVDIMETAVEAAQDARDQEEAAKA